MRLPGFAIGLLALVLSAGGGAADEIGGQPLLGEYNFDTESYTLLVLTSGPVRHPVQQQLGNFYVDDRAVLNILKNSWVTGGPAPQHACGFHYDIIVLADKEILENLAYNLEIGCGAITTDWGAFYFDQTLLTKHQAAYRKTVVEERSFGSFEEGRAYLAAIDSDPRLLMRMYPNWREYDGEFRFMAPCPGHGYDDAKVNACLDDLRAEIAARHPGKSFDLMESGGDGDNVLVEMKCSKALRERFDLYEDYFKWRDYEPVVTLYWRQAG